MTGPSSRAYVFFIFPEGAAYLAPNGSVTGMFTNAINAVVKSSLPSDIRSCLLTYAVRYEIRAPSWISYNFLQANLRLMGFDYRSLVQHCESECVLLAEAGTEFPDLRNALRRLGCPASLLPFLPRTDKAANDYLWHFDIMLSEVGFNHLVEDGRACRIVTRVFSSCKASLLITVTLC